MGKRKLFSSGVSGKRDGGAKVLVATLFILLIVYVLSLVLVLGWGVLTSLKSSADFNINKNLLGLPTVSQGQITDEKREDLNNDESRIEKYFNYVNSKDELFKLSNYKKFFEEFRINDGNHSESFSILFGTVDKTTHVGKDHGEGQGYYADFWDMLINSLIYSLGGSFVQTLAISVMAYMCAKYKFRFSKIIYTMVIVLLALPIIGAYPAEISLLRDLGMYDTWWGNFIQKFGFIGMYFLVFYETFDGMSDTYRDAASIDGASQWMVMTRVYMPLAIKMFGSVMLVRFVFFWNDYSGIRMYMRTHPTLSYGVFYNTIAQPMGGGIPVQVAACMVLAIPILVLFICLQEKIMGSMTLGGLKE